MIQCFVDRKVDRKLRGSCRGDVKVISFMAIGSRDGALKAELDPSVPFSFWTTRSDSHCIQHYRERRHPSVSFH